MAAGITNFDSSFFEVLPFGFVATDQADWLNKRIISFTVKEQMYGMMTGNIQIMDTDFHEAAFIFKPGRQLSISWGYKNTTIFSDGMALARNPQQMVDPTGGFIARRCLGMIKGNVGGTMDDKGQVIFNCPFVAFGQFPFDMTETFNYDVPGVTKGVLVVTELQKLGIAKPLVGFRRGVEPCSGVGAIKKDNRNAYSFLRQCALEWRCMFRIAFDMTGMATAIFCDFDNEGLVAAFLATTTGAFGNSGLFEWKQGIANVKSATWGFDSAEGGGDSARIIMGPQGTPIIYRTVATTESVIVYKMDTEKVMSVYSGLDLPISVHSSYCWYSVNRPL